MRVSCRAISIGWKVSSSGQSSSGFRMCISTGGGLLSKSNTISLSSWSMSSRRCTTLEMHSTHFLMDLGWMPSRKEVRRCSSSVSSEKS